MSFKQAMLRTGISALIFAVSFCYAMLIVPQDGYIDIREAILTVGGMLFAAGYAAYSWFRFLWKKIQDQLDRRTMQKTNEHKAKAWNTNLAHPKRFTIN